MKIIKMTENPEDDWARIELYRWQNGHLPGEKGIDEKPFDEAAGLRGMADAIERGCKTGQPGLMPTPFNVCAVLRYMASRIEKGKS